MAGLGSYPSIENLQCFLAAAEHLNFRRAASTVALTPTAFGQRIRQLEEQLGVSLFARTTRSVALTEAGLALVPEARQLIEQARRCAASVAEDEPPVTLTLGSRYELTASWLAPALAELGRDRPHWCVHIYCGSGPDIIDRLQGAGVDAIITSAPVARAGWAAEVLHPERYEFVAAPGLLADEPLDGPDDCARHVLLDVDRSLPLARYVTAASGPRLIFRQERYLGSGGAMRAMVLAGRGVCVLPHYMVAADLAEGALVRVLPDRELLTDTFRLIFKMGSPLERPLRELADVLRGQPLR